MIKFLLFYGGLFLAVSASILRALVWPPKIIGHTIVDQDNFHLVLTLRTKRSLQPIRIYNITVPTEYANLLELSPPKEFIEDSDTYIGGYLFDGEKRELLDWNGDTTVNPRQSIEVRIPINNLVPMHGTIQITYEVRHFVCSLGGSNFIPFAIA